MKRFSKTMLAVATAAALGLGVAGTAQADALATSILQLNNLEFNDPTSGAIITNGVNVVVVGFTQNASASATLNGVTQDSGTVVGVGIDIAPQCVGACGDARLADNVFGVFSTALGDPAINVSSADQREAGSPVANIGLPTPATVEASSITSLVDGGAGNAHAQNGLTAQFDFIVTGTGTVEINFDALAYLEAFVTPGGLGENAQATYSTSFRLTQNVGGVQNTIFTWAPDGLPGGIVGGVEVLDPFTLNANVASIDPAGGVSAVGAAVGVKNAGAFQALTPVLLAGQRYTLSASMDTDVIAVAIPEPATLGLFSLALLGMGAALRRRRMAS
jgi:hypothetical protein